MITGINHITLSVRDLAQSLAFYVDVLGCAKVTETRTGHYLRAGDLWLALELDGQVRGGPLPEYTHIAFSVRQEDYEGMANRIRASGAEVFKENKSEGDSLYFLDPNGHRLEIHVGDLDSRLAVMAAHPETSPKSGTI